MKTYFRSNRFLFSFLFFMASGLFSLQAQTNLITELTGNPPDLSDWTNVGVDVEGEEIVLTQATSSEQGALFYSEPFNLNQCVKWKIEFDFRIYGGNPHADGLAFWYLENPPQNFGSGGDIGMPGQSHGLKVVFDTYDNDNDDFINHRPNPEIQVYYGTGYSEHNSVIPHDNMLLSYWPGLIDPEYQHAVISWNDGYIEVTIDGEDALSGDVQAFNGVENIEEGYFGFSSSTGLYFDRHSIKNVKVYNNAIDLDNEVYEIVKCDLDGEGFMDFNLTEIEEEIDSDEADMFLYYLTEEDALADSNPILDPYIFTNTVEGGQTLYFRVENQEGCFSIGELIIIVDTPPVPEMDEITLATCVSQGVDEVEYDLTETEGQFFEDSSAFSFTYYHTESDAIEANDEAITEPESYISEGEEVIYVRVEGESPECFTILTITITNIDPPVVEDVEDLSVCGNNDVYSFDLTQNDELVKGDQEGMQVLYFETEEDAIAGENAIENPAAFEAELTDCEVIYVRIQSENDETCFSVGQFQVCGYELEAGQAEDLFQCGVYGVEEFLVFDLTSNDNAILNGLNPEEYTIDYYESAEDAEVGDNPIEEPEVYPVESGSITIYYRMESETGCYAIGSFEVHSLESELMEIGSEEVCMDQKINLNNYFSEFEVIDYYSSLEDLQNGNPIENPEEFLVEESPFEIFALVNTSDQCPVIYHLVFSADDCEIFIPEGFSPNGDSINDSFEISGLDGAEYSLKIYSRYGRLIYDGSEKSEFWDGNSKKGKKVPTGTYYYVLKTDRADKPIKGWVYLNR